GNTPIQLTLSSSAIKPSGFSQMIVSAQDFLKVSEEPVRSSRMLPDPFKLNIGLPVEDLLVFGPPWSASVDQKGIQNEIQLGRYIPNPIDNSSMVSSDHQPRIPSS